MALRTSGKSNGSGRANTQQALEKITSKQILDTLRAWQNENEAIDSKALLKALRAYRNGDFTTRLSENQTGIAGEIARAFNESIALNQLLLKEFDRIGKSVGREGKISQRVAMSAATGSWAGYVDSFNGTIDGLVEPVNEFGRVVTSLAKGDLSEPMALESGGRPLRGEFLRLAKITNNMIGTLNGFAEEVTRVAREVGTEGMLGGQANVKGVSGIWQDLTDTVNTMANNLTSQVRNISEVTTAVANGDLNKKITADVKGEVLELKDTINVMVDQLRDFSSEVTRVAQEVGTDGVLGGQASVRGVSGVWLELTNNVNAMANNLTSQVRDIARVTTAVADGDLDQQITVEVKGEVLALKNTINAMVDQLAQFADQVTNVAREVGTEGKLGGQANVKGVSGIWEDLTNNVNAMANNLTAQVRDIARVTTAVADGDLEQKITVEVKGEVLALKDTINTMVDQLRQFSSEVTRVAWEVGSDGKLGGQADVKGVSGTWKELTENVNAMAGNLTSQVRDIAKVTTAVANGDLEQKITVDVKGEVLALKDTINTMVDQLRQFSSEVTRVAWEVGTDGKLGGQADVKGVSGTWKELTNNVNAMASNLTSQVRDIAVVATAVANGDLDKKVTVKVSGEVLELKDTINVMVDQLSQFSSEVTRVAREVGTDGKLGGQAEVKGVSGTWKELTNNVNAMAGNLTSQVRDIAQVATAVANGDLEQKVIVDVKGEVLELKDTINTMVDRLSQFSFEVMRVAREVGTDGKLGGQAEVKGVTGTWKELTDNVNAMAGNLTTQVRDIAQVATAVANGDLDQKITVDVKGEVLELKDTINTMVDRLSQFSSEVTRVAREVGTDGILGGQAEVKGVSGTWKDLTDNVNAMAGNLTTQVRDIAQVATAVANGDLDQKVTVDVKGEVLELKDTINTMVDRLSQFSSEVTRVAREVGTDGILGGQAEVKGVSGTWKDLTDNVNAMAGNLTTQVRDIAQVATAVANGDLDQKVTVAVRGEVLELKDTINTMVDQLRQFSSEVTRVAREVGTDGKLGGQAEVKGVSGTWKDLTDNVNAMAGNLTTQVRDIAQVATAVANGDLEQEITVEAKGEVLELKETINIMVNRLGQFSTEVTRVAMEVGTEGVLGGQADVKGVSGVWRNLTENVNTLAENLTSQVRNISEVTKAVAAGDLNRKITTDAKGEVLELKDTINTMTEMLSIFSRQVTGVAQEVGTEGKLGGQAEVSGVQGTWKELTDNVNELADNLTRQVRAILEVVTDVTNGDFTGAITVEAKGEVELLKNNLNQMILTLKETTETNTEQDWLKTNLSKFSSLMQGNKDLYSLSEVLISELCAVITAQHGVFYALDSGVDEQPKTAELKLLSSFAYRERKQVSNTFKIGESLIGQCAREKKLIVVHEVPDDYIKINSGLGELKPLNIIVLPVLFEEELIAVIELASFNRFSEIQMSFLDQLMMSVGIVANAVVASTRTQNLLQESQSLGEELQTQQEELQQSNKKLEQQAKTLTDSELLLKNQQEELQQTNEELEEKSKVLADQKAEVEIKNHEVEQARQALEEKAGQLALTSKYKSEFLANMSHELRTPLNSLLILSESLTQNKERNLNDEQLKKLTTIHGSGVELFELINEILDLAKIESGLMSIDIKDIHFKQIQDWAERNFQQIAEDKKLAFNVSLHKNLAKFARTDEKRLLQVLKNLLSNAFKFTDKGRVDLTIAEVLEGWDVEHPVLNKASRVIAFTVRDTGIGIAADKQQIIFEAFQQADGTTSRKYGGTGLGLSITREIALILGGEIVLNSSPGEGSTFTFFIPQEYISPPSPTASGRGEPAELASITKIADKSLGNAFEENDRRNLLLISDIEDDRGKISENDRVILIVEDDVRFAKILLDMTREQGFKGIIALSGEAGLACAQEFKPDAILLDIRLPVMNGWTVLDRIKHDSNIRHIPVHITSIDDVRQRSLRSGALSFLKKPADEKRLADVFSNIKKFQQKGLRQLLILEDDKAQREALIELIGNGDVKVTAVATAKQALVKLKAKQFDCMVVDLMLPDMDGFELIEKIKEIPQLINLPIIIYTGKELSEEENTKLQSVAETVIVKDVRSPERLLDETALFLHRVETKLPESKRQMLQQVHENDPALHGRKILIVDDDVRNIYALSTILEGHDTNTLYAESGKQALETLQQHPDIEIILMDIMMPDMDGYETMRAIRKMKKYKQLPIIAVTAKAMQEDRQKCIDAGASDYLVKPIDTKQLLSLMRVWLYK